MARGRQKGTIKTGGRVKGQPNRETIAKTEFLNINQVNEKIKSGEMMSPLDFLMSVINDPKYSDTNRISAANTAIKYCHKTKPVETEVTLASLGAVPSLVELYSQMNTDKE